MALCGKLPKWFLIIYVPPMIIFAYTGKAVQLESGWPCTQENGQTCWGEILQRYWCSHHHNQQVNTASLEFGVSNNKVRKYQQMPLNLFAFLFLPLFSSCPLEQQNYDYAMYLLTVLYHESWVSSSFFLHSAVSTKPDWLKLKQTDTSVTVTRERKNSQWLIRYYKSLNVRLCETAHSKIDLQLLPWLLTSSTRGLAETPEPVLCPHSSQVSCDFGLFLSLSFCLQTFLSISIHSFKGWLLFGITCTEVPFERVVWGQMRNASDLKQWLILYIVALWCIM